MPQAVVIVEALRCQQCHTLIDPVQGTYFRRQMKTAVAVGRRVGMVEHYEVVTLCSSCNHAVEEQAAREQQRIWWFRFWGIALIANIVLISFFPVGWFPLYALIAGRVVWEWRARRHAAPLLEGHSSQERLRRPGSSTGL